MIHPAGLYRAIDFTGFAAVGAAADGHKCAGKRKCSDVIGHCSSLGCVLLKQTDVLGGGRGSNDGTGPNLEAEVS